MKNFLEWFLIKTILGTSAAGTETLQELRKDRHNRLLQVLPRHTAQI